MNKIIYDYDEETRSIILPQGAPFDGKPIMVKFAEGWCEAWWVNVMISTEPYPFDDPEGWEWCCLDDKFQKPLDDALGWLPLPDDKSKASIKDIVTEFYYTWHNSGGTNTSQGFDDWWKINKARFGF